MQLEKTLYVFLEWRTFSVESLSEVSNWWLLLFHPICFSFTLKKITIQANKLPKKIIEGTNVVKKYDRLYSVDCQAVCFLLTKELDQCAFNGNRIISRCNYKSPPLDHTDDCVIVKTGSETFDKWKWQKIWHFKLIREWNHLLFATWKIFKLYFLEYILGEVVKNGIFTVRLTVRGGGQPPRPWP